MKINDEGWVWMKVNELEWRWIKIKECKWRLMKANGGVRRKMKVNEGKLTVEEGKWKRKDESEGSGRSHVAFWLFYK